MKLKRISIIAAFILSCTSLFAQAPQYEVTILITANEAETYGASINALNNKGESVGMWSQSEPYHQEKTGGLLIYPNATAVSLPNLIDTCADLLIYDLNDNTQMVGGCNDFAMYYILYSSSSGDSLILSSNYSSAYAINNAGQIVGTSNVARRSYILEMHAVIFSDNGTAIDLGGFQSTPYAGLAADINDRYGADGFGQIVGSIQLSMPPHFQKAFLYENGLMSNIGRIICPNQESVAEKINNKGGIAGYCYNEQYGGYNYDGFIYGSSTGTYAIFPGCALLSINDDGWAIGNEDPYTETAAGYLIINGIMHNLLDLILPAFGVTAVRAIDINDQGQILAWTNLGYVLLSPIHDR